MFKFPLIKETDGHKNWKPSQETDNTTVKKPSSTPAGPGAHYQVTFPSSALISYNAEDNSFKSSEPDFREHILLCFSICKWTILFSGYICHYNIHMKG